MAIKTLKLPFGQMKGLMQGIDKSLLSFSYSPDCQNIEVSEGMISTRKGINNLFAAPTDFVLQCIYPFGTLEHIAGFQYKPGGIYVDNSFSWRVYCGAWCTITTDGTTPAITQYNPAKAKFMHYQKDGSDIILGVFDSYRPSSVSLATSPASLVKIYKHGALDYRLVDLTATASAPSGATDIALHRERVWLARGDSVHYSNAYDPEDWTTAGETGSINIYTQDGTAVSAIANLMDDVVILKQESIHVVSGDTPSEYSITQIYAEQGTTQFKSVCSDGNNCFFAGDDGIYRYIGTETTPLLTDEIKTLFSAMTTLKCLVNNNKLYIFNTAGTTHIVYDIRRKTIEVISGMSVVDAYVDGNVVYITNATTISRFLDTVLLDGSTAISAYWITPESSLGYPNAEKLLNDLYFTAWGTTSAGAAGGQVKVTVYYNKNGTEKTKEKTITLQTTRKPHAISYNLPGRLFKFKFENVSGSAINITDIVPVFELSED